MKAKEEYEQIAVFDLKVKKDLHKEQDEHDQDASPSVATGAGNDHYGHTTTHFRHMFRKANNPIPRMAPY